MTELTGNQAINGNRRSSNLLANMGFLGPWPGARPAAAPIVMQITPLTLQNATFYPCGGDDGREMRYMRITLVYQGTAAGKVVPDYSIW